MSTHGFKRELKYYINTFDYYSLNSRLKAFLSNDPNADKNGEYSIRSLYFDDVNNSGLCEKLGGVKSRSKYRIRIYNRSDNLIKLEKKIKVDDMTRKDVELISRDDYEKIVGGNVSFLKSSGDELLVEFYQKYLNVLLRPRVIVDYVRDAYVVRGGHVRITFDKHLRTGLSSTDLFGNNVPFVRVLEAGYMILEIKYDDFLPDYIRNSVQLCDRNRFSISKYALCRNYSKANIWEEN